MSKFIGRLKSLGVAKEATRGTLVAPTDWVPKVSMDVDDKVQKARFDGNYGNIAGGDEAIVALKHAEGDLEMEVQDNSIAYFLEGLFGSLSSASFSGAYKHTLTLLNSVQHPSLSLFINDPIGAAADPTKTTAFARAMITSLNLVSELGELVKTTIGFMANSHTDYSRQTVTAAAENKFSHQHVTFKIATNLAGLDAATRINLQSLSLNINKNVIRENALGTVQPIDILNKKIEIAGTLRLLYEDRSYRDLMLDGTKKAVRITLNNTDVTIGTTTPQVQIDLPIVDFHDWEAPDDLDEIAMQEIQFTALYDVTNDILIGANTFIVNDTASY